MPGCKEVEPVSVEFISAGARVRGRFFGATGAGPVPTLLLVPGWPGNPDDVLGLGAPLAERGVNVCTFNPRGLHQSEGTASHPNTLQDISAALGWLRRADAGTRLAVDPASLVLGGHSYGGGMAMAYAARDPSVRRIVSVAGTDHGELAREIRRNAAFAQVIRELLGSTRVPEGPVRFDVEECLAELADHQDVYGLRENAARLADRSILICGGWEDEQTTIDQYLLPLYRALKGAGAQDVNFVACHADHSFSNVRDRLASDIAAWILRDRGDEPPPGPRE